MKKNKAFTLSEVLITIVVIGVVAAITVPVLYGEYQKQATVEKLKKAYSMLGQVIERSRIDVGVPENVNEMDPNTYFDRYWRPYLTSVKICDYSDRCGYKENIAFTCANGAKAGTAIVYPSRGITFVSNDGVVYMIRVTSSGASGEYGYFVLVDINGSNPPDRYGRDVFLLLHLDEKGVVKAEGYDKTTAEVNSNCSKNGDGRYCAEKIIRDGWKIKKDYPW